METQRFAELVDHVVAEVHDMLDAGRVGVYELCEVMRGDLPETENLAVAKAAYARLLDEKKWQLIWLVWPSFEPVPGPAVAGDRPEHWETPTEAPYPALAPLDYP